MNIILQFMFSFTWYRLIVQRYSSEVTQCIIYRHKNMQTPIFNHQNTSPSMFQEILQACSIKSFENEEQIIKDQYLQANHHEGGINIRLESDPSAWFLMEQTPFQTFRQQKDSSKEEIHLQFKRVKSSRQEQQTKIATFLRQDKYKSLKQIEIQLKSQSPTGKYSQSLSPKKTKKIDKNKQPKFILESD